MATTAVGTRTTRESDPAGVRIYSLVVSSIFFLLLVLAAMHLPQPIGSALVVFVLVAAVADAMRIPLGSEMTFAVSMPVVLAAGMVLVPWQAAIVGFMGTADLREVRREVPLSRAVFNRSLVGVCALASSYVFHSAGGDVTDWPTVLIPALAALVADVVVNAALVTWPVAQLRHCTLASVLGGLVKPDPFWSAVRYACTGLMAPLLAAAWMFAGVFGLVACLLPLALAWLAFREAQDLNETRVSAARTRQALAAAVEETAAERSDERHSLAGDLHDEVLPALFKVHLMGQVIKNDLENGRLLELDEDVAGLLSATGMAQDATRGLVGSLRVSPLGSRGLRGTLQSLIDGLDASGAPSVELQVEGVDGDERLQVVAYQVAREAITNAARYARASTIRASLWVEGVELRVQVVDDGIGFDTSRRSAEPGHFGLDLMRERVDAVGGSFSIQSQLGGGTCVVASLPLTPTD